MNAGSFDRSAPLPTNEQTTVFMTPDYRAGNPYQELLARSLADHGVTVKFPSGDKRGLPILRGVRAYARQARVVHLHWLDPFFKSATFAEEMGNAIRLLFDLLLCRISGLRLIWTVHNLVSHGSRNPILERWLQLGVAKLANGIICHSMDARRRIAKEFKIAETSITVIPHGEFHSWYGDGPPQREARKALGVPEGALVILFLGYVKPYKGVEALLTAWKQSINKPMSARLVIAGECADSKYRLDLLSRAQSDGSIILRLGRVPDCEIACLLKAADVFALPVANTLTSGSLVLAKSYGMPVLAPDYPAIAEYCQGAGDFLYRAADPDALTSKLIDLIGRWHQESRQPSEIRFDWSDVSRSTIETYSSAA